MNRSDPIGQSVGSLTDRSRRLLRDERLARKAGWLQAVHPAVKFLGIVSLVGITVTFENPGPPLAMLGLSIAFALCSRVPLRGHLLRTAVPMGIAVAVVAPQAVLLSGESIAGPVSADGARYVATFALRVGASVSLLALLLSTTRFSALMGGFRTLRIPRTATALLTITYRYLLVVFEELARLVLARRSRRIRPATLGESWREAGGLLGTFLLGAFERGERVGRSARARGGTTGRAYRPRDDVGIADAGFAFVVVASVTAGVVLV